MTDMGKAALQGFLDQHGLGQYFEVMVSEDIGLDDLPDLEEADLKELGLSIGHRKALRRALAPADGPDEPEAQRRQVTILFCDLVGSTELASRYDAEDMSEVYERYHRHVTKVVESAGGRRLYTQGDGLVACWGYPKASENDAERAASAALEISRGIPRQAFDDDLVLHTRIGIATGRVFVRGQAEESSALVGDTLNLASRLQDAAPVDGVVVGVNTYRLIEKSAKLEHFDRRGLKGFDEEVDIWRLVAMRDVADRPGNKLGQPTRTAELLGREEEFGRIKDRWATTRTGSGQVIVLSGEPGIGKSYLLAAARDLAQDDGAEVIRYYCAPGYENSVLYPVRMQILRGCQLSDADTPAQVADKLAAYGGSDDPVALRLLADLISADPGAAFPPLDMTATEQKQATFALLQRQLQMQAHDRPVMLLLEDAHWADPTTLELLAEIVTGIVADRLICVVITHRPQISLDWGALDHVVQIPLDRLSQSESRQIVSRVMEGQALPADMLHKIVDASDGIPLFLEELSRTVMEQQDGAAGGYSAVSVPITLEDSLMARLDRLGGGKSIVQTAAVFGRRFLTPGVREVLGMAETPFNQAIAEPVEARILVPDGSETKEAMLFRHALVQQAAYEGIPRKQRQQLHARIAALILEFWPSLAEKEPETLARHHAGAGEFSQAITYLIAAGKKATSRAAQIEAANHYFAALDHLAHLPEGRDRDGMEVMLRALLGGALMATRGFAAPEVHDAFARARELCIALGDNPMFCSCLYGLFTVAASRSNKDEAMALADEMLATFAEAPVPSWVIASYFAKGVAAFFHGDLEEAATRFDHVAEIYTPDQHPLLVEQFGDDLAEFSMCYRHWIHLFRGELDRSRDVLSRAEAMADELNNRNAQTRSIAFRMGRQMEMGKAAEVAQMAPKLIEISTVQGYPYWACAGQIGLGWAMALSGQEEGIEPIAGSLGFFDLIGQSLPQPYWRCYLIAAHTALGQRDAALGEAEKALEMSRAGLDKVFDPVILLRQGEAHLLEPADPEAAEASFRAAMDVADRLGSHLYGFLATLGLAELLVAQGRGEEEGGALAKAMPRVKGEDFDALERAGGVLARL